MEGVIPILIFLLWGIFLISLGPDYRDRLYVLDAIRESVLRAGGRDVRIERFKGKQLRYRVTFASPKGRYYQTWCAYDQTAGRDHRVSWVDDLAEILADAHPELQVDVRREDQKGLLVTQSRRLVRERRGKEQLINLLHSTYRNERLWGIQLAAELDVIDGPVVDQLRILAASDPIKKVRLAATDRLNEIEHGLLTVRI